MKRGYLDSLVSILALLWMVSIVVVYYAGHKPFALPLVAHLGRAVWLVGVTCLVAAVAGGLGRKVLSEGGYLGLTGIILQFATGLGLISILVLAFGAWIGISSRVAWGLLLLIAILTRREALAWCRQFDEQVRHLQTNSLLAKFVAIGGGWLMSMALVTALAPPLKFDALVYHLVMPKTYLEAGRVIYMPSMFYWGMPQSMEMIYTWVMALAGDEMAALSGLLVGIFALLGLLSYTIERFDSRSGWVALASLLSVYTLSVLLPSAYVDWLAVLFGFGVLALLDTWRLTYRKGYLIWSGVLTGMAFGTKYTAGVLIVAGIGLIISESLSKAERRKELWVNVSLFLAAVIALSSPWIVKNVLATGNPLYPFFLPAGGVDRFRLENYQVPIWGDWKDFFLLPFQATLNGHEGAPGYSATIGPLLLALAPLAFLRWRRTRLEMWSTITSAGIIAGIGLLVWGGAGRLSGFLIQSRLYFSIFPCLAVLAGAGFANLSQYKMPGVRLGRVGGALVLIVLGLTLLQISLEFIERGSLRVLGGLETSDQYLDANLGWYAPTMRAINDLPEDARVLMLWEPRSYYCLPRCIPDEVLDRWRHDRQIWKDSQPILTSWREAGFTHILYAKFNADFVRKTDLRYEASDWMALEELLSQLKAVGNFGEAYVLYSLKP